MRSIKDLINSQGGRSELSSFQVGNGERSGDLIDCPDGQRENPKLSGGKGRRDELS
jgi:hypothetical protein